MTYCGRQITVRCFDTGILVELISEAFIFMYVLIVGVCMHVCVYVCMSACQRLFLFSLCVCLFGALATGRPAVQMVVPNISGEL